MFDRSLMQKIVGQLLMVALLFLAGGNVMATEEPRFTLLSKEGAIELRQYAPMLLAETRVGGDMDQASSQGFRLIADFIFGNNRATGGAEGSAKIAMTAPVTVVPEASERWRVHFVMPSQYTLATLPQPNNNAVTLREVPARRYAVLTYSGFNTESRVQQHTAELLAWLRANKLNPTGPAQLARYDPPWTLPMWRRNEIMFEIPSP